MTVSEFLFPSHLMRPMEWEEKKQYQCSIITKETKATKINSYLALYVLDLVKFFIQINDEWVNAHDQEKKTQQRRNSRWESEINKTEEKKEKILKIPWASHFEAAARPFSSSSYCFYYCFFSWFFVVVETFSPSFSRWNFINLQCMCVRERVCVCVCVCECLTDWTFYWHFSGSVSIEMKSFVETMARLIFVYMCVRACVWYCWKSV